MPSILSRLLRLATPAPLALLATACSTVPSRHWPAHAEVGLTVEYRAPAGGTVRLPASSPTLTILEWATEPEGVVERFENGERVLQLPPGDSTLLVRCRYRAYADGDGVPPPERLFPGGRIVERFQP